ncbi:MAG: pyridoxal-phosphate dependent enzyme [Burkholderiales bacterium]|nr:pyridoxal-phosphate dependent enzyme [Burkholderiales bacterium]
MSPPRLLSTMVPGLESLIRPVDLVVRPTPLTQEKSLAERWDLQELWIKRDDLSSPVYGGSKVRNLEYFFGDALAKGADCVATMGPLGSHQVLATATFGRLHGLHTRALLTPQPNVHEAALNQRLLPSLNMEFIRCERFIDVPLGFLRIRYRRHQDKRPYWIPPGSHHPIGVLGVIEGALEIVASIRNGELRQPDDIVVPTGTCATAAGLWLGLAMADMPIRIVAVRMVPMMITGISKMKKLAMKTLEMLRRAGYRGQPKFGEILWIDEFAAPGYGQTNAGAEQAARDVAECSDFRTETTYIAKTLAMFRAKNLAGRRVLFWNTYSAVDPDPETIPFGVSV